MKTFEGVKGNFGFAVVTAGQRNVVTDPELIAVSTEGGFRITGAITRVLGVQHGDYVMFINNIANIDRAIAEKVPELVDFVEENGLEWGSPEATIAIHKEFDMWAIARGIQEFDSKGLPVMGKERLTKEDRMRLVNAKYEEMLAAALESDNKELVEALSREDATDEEKKNILCPFVQPVEVPKFKGSKVASPSSVTGLGVNLTFTDSNVWAQLKADLGNKATAINRVYTIDLDNVQKCVINNGYEDVEVSMFILGKPTDKAPVARVAAKKEAEADGEVEE